MEHCYTNNILKWIPCNKYSKHGFHLQSYSSNKNFMEQKVIAGAKKKIIKTRYLKWISFELLIKILLYQLRN